MRDGQSFRYFRTMKSKTHIQVSVDESQDTNEASGTSLRSSMNNRDQRVSKAADSDIQHVGSTLSEVAPDFPR